MLHWRVRQHVLANRKMKRYGGFGTLVIADRRADMAFGVQGCGGGGIADGWIVGGILCWLWLWGQYLWELRSWG